jgi:hypothetical protein
MKVGDLVGVISPFGTIHPTMHGIIIETGVYTGNNDVKVMWNNEKIMTYKSRDLRIIE